MSTRDQHAQGQIDALNRAGCVKVFTDTASGKLATRPALDAVMAYLRDGEDTLVITRPGRLGRSVINLKTISDTLVQRSVALRVIEQDIDTTTASGRMFLTIMASVAEFERDLVVERTHEGLAAARARGRVGGRRPKMTPTKIKAARAMYDSREHTIAEIAQTFSVTPSTIYRHLDPDCPQPARRAGAGRRWDEVTRGGVRAVLSPARRARRAGLGEGEDLVAITAHPGGQRDR